MRLLAHVCVCESAKKRAAAAAQRKGEDKEVAKNMRAAFVVVAPSSGWISCMPIGKCAALALSLALALALPLSHSSISFSCFN